MPICPRHGIDLIQPIGELQDVCPTCEDEKGEEFPDDVLELVGLSRDDI